ncbi:MAG TPA: type I pullulanase, partial [Eubacteriaceae bacterium]|nr:type I pullulanase [Eubacteriaceae bacterium]
MKKSNDESIMKVVKKKFGCWMENGRFIFRIWAPDWDSVHLSIYDHPFDLCRTLHPMIQHEDQTFEITLDDPLDGKYYTYLLENQYEITDPFSRAVSVNSQRSAIVSLKETNPKGWWEQNRPRLEDPVDAIVYEMHVKDFTIDHSSGVALRGKYLGAAEKGTTHNEVATGLDHLKELGITHIHLMPVFDFLTVDEEEHLFFKEDNYNWGYDPEHYNV